MIQLLNQDLATNTLEPWPTIFLTTALAWFLLCNIVLFVIDVREHRLPNKWTGLLVAGAGMFLLASTFTATDASVLSGRWVATLVGSGSYLAVMLLLHIITRAGIGMGDVKLAAGLGLYTGFIGLDAFLAGVVLAFVIGGLQAVFVMVFRGATKSTLIAFGPAMILGCVVSVLM